MSTHPRIARICAVCTLLALAVTVLFMNGAALGLTAAGTELGYESRLFDTSRVHTLDLVMDGWEDFLFTCENEEYSVCAAVIDGESYKNIAIRAKGNTSLSAVSSLGSQRYSFKIEFDHYDSGKTYHGLDKLSLNNLIQDNTMMKDYLSYRMMNAFGVDSPLCSYVYLTVNGEDWGLYLAVEGVEDAFLQRNYGAQAGELYKPDSLSFGGGRGNGEDFRMEDFLENGGADFTPPEGMELPDGDFTPPDGAQADRNAQPAGRDGMQPGKGVFTPPDGTQRPEGEAPDGGDFPGDSGMGSADVKLQYIDDDPDSYSNIFSNTKTDVSAADQARLIASLKSLSAYENLSEVLDQEEVLRYFVVHSFVVNGDSYTGSMIHNYYLYEQGGQLSMIPWDYNLAFGTFQAADAVSAVNDPIDEPLSDRPMQAWIFESGQTLARYHALYAEFLESVDIQGLIDEAYALIAPYVEKDPTRFCTAEEFETGVQALRSFCALRAQSVQGQLDGSVPSTEAAQQENPDALVQTQELALSDMGTMNQGGGQAGPGRR